MDVTAFLLPLSLINEIFIRKLKTFGNHLKNRRSKWIIVIKIVSRGDSKCQNAEC